MGDGKHRRRDVNTVTTVGKDPQVSDSEVANENWVLEYNDFIPDQQKRREVLCASGNGYFVTRASAPESKANGVHCPGTYVAGIYNRLTTQTHNMVLEREDLVNMPDWLSLTFAIDENDWFDLSKVEIFSYKQWLNLREGIIYRQVHFKDQKKRETTLFERRFVHMRHCHLGGLETVIKAHNWSGTLTIRSAIDGQVTNATAVYEGADKKHLKPIESNVQDDILYLKMQTSQSCVTVAQAVRTSIFCNDESIEVQRTNIVQPDYVAQDIRVSLSEGERVIVQKIASLFTSRDFAISEAGLAARDAVTDGTTFATLIEDQIETWRHYWCHFDLTIEAAEEVSKAHSSLLLHLNIYHVLAVASANSITLDTGLPARGWSEGYQGHVFWDDLYVFPLFTLRMPAITRSLLKYRYCRLSEARKLAKSMGTCGARFPWQSGSTGREETPAGGWNTEKNVWIPDRSHLQIHINAAIAYNFWHYYQASGDLEFMYVYGADVLLEIARFFVHFAQYNAERDRYEIHGVVGPDEIHINYPDSKDVGINNNAYTNLMAVWTIARALELLHILPEQRCDEIRDRLNLEKEELDLWDRVSRKMFIPIQDNGIISQFEGYDKLQPFPWQKDGSVDIKHLDQILKDQGGFANQYQVSKQADVLMLFYLFSSKELEELFHRLGYPFDAEMIPENIAFYVPQTANYSTLSRVAVAWVLSRMDRPRAWQVLSDISHDKNMQRATPLTAYPHSWDIFKEALGSDIQAGSTPEGIHLGAMAGTVDIVQRCYTGIVTKDDVLWVNPRLPDALVGLSFQIQYRQQSVRLEIEKKKFTVSTERSGATPIQIGFKDKVYELSPSESKVFHY